MANCVELGKAYRHNKTGIVLCCAAASNFPLPGSVELRGKLYGKKGWVHQWNGTLEEFYAQWAEVKEGEQ
jgi:hypothetical protein